MECILRMRGKLQLGEVGFVLENENIEINLEEPVMTNFNGFGEYDDSETPLL